MMSVKTLLRIAKTLDRDANYFLAGVTLEEFALPREAVRRSD